MDRKAGLRERGQPFEADRLRKVAVNLRIDSTLVAEAKAAGMNLSALLAETLEARLKATRAARWAAENAEGLAWVDRFLDEHGASSEHFAKL